MASVNVNSGKKSARIEARVTPELKEMIELAASYSDRSVSDFILHNMELVARKVVEEHDRIVLNQEQSLQLAEHLLAPPEPNDYLKSTMAEYRKRAVSR